MTSQKDDKLAQATRKDLQPGIDSLADQIQHAPVSDKDKAILAVSAGIAIVKNVTEKVMVNTFKSSANEEEEETFS
ncbi:hypothetical protein [Pseudovibrio sp. Tun.PSC04-5.I4]|uniref:hypothetical protein n=1 Tax=Pseudovibrio sp. Tun.PSC04-5.I4 TaxID=1798213 RepID=UPI000883BFE1|nr:hypothetical protein [Pseudovibrio sp. Tun.PSC04-5.I4]SDQ27549.1 hypothetical protein SAMN04515695_0679 [Pseudovibrio sp. Tun.PSC04-5.I4]SDR10156.1 hypothetical protein SAMN04515695_2769 [Pseudovibrio sp. Tun.PSC04-5.I4]